MSHFGEFAAILTAVFWTVTALSFESAGKRVGSLAVNYIRLVVAFAFLSLYGLIRRGMPLPLDASAHNWLWLSASGLVGFSLGDLLLFRSYVVIGSRVSLLIMALVPPITAITSWLVLGEVMPPVSLLAMCVTMSGIAMVVLTRHPDKRRLTFSYPLGGLLLAFGGAVGQALGLVLSKYGMADYDAFSATQIRIVAGFAGFTVLFAMARAWHRLPPALRNGPAMKRITLGAFFGPFLGVSFSLLAVQHTQAGTASTIMSLTPVLVIAPSALLFHEKVRLIEMVGALVAVAGVVLFFL